MLFYWSFMQPVCFVVEECSRGIILLSASERDSGWYCYPPNTVKAAKYETQKPSTCRATFFRGKFWVDISRFSTCVINLSRNKNICCGLKKVVAKSKARVYFEQ